MNRRIFILLFALLCTATSQKAVAQFSVKTDASQTSPAKPIVKVAPPTALNINVFAEKQRKLEKKRLRKEHNTVQLNTALTFTQVSFSNWSAGGNNSIAGAVAIYLNHVYNKKNVNIQNIVDAAYGLSRIDRKMRKQEDRFDYSTTFGWRLHDQWYISSTLNLKSQFDAGYKYPNDSTVVSKFLAPGYLTLGAGIKYLSKNQKLSIELDPITGRLSMVMDKALAATGSFGVEKGKYVYPELGSKLIIHYQTPFLRDKFVFRTKFEIFSNYSKKPTFLSESWLDFKIAKFFWFKFYINMFYDQEAKTPVESSKLQINQTAGLGIAYSFNNK